MRKLSQNDLYALACRVYQNLQQQAEIAQDKLNAIQDKENAKKAKAIIAQVAEFDRMFKKMPFVARNVIQNRYGSKSTYDKRIYGELAKGLDLQQLVESMRKKQITVKLPEQPNSYNKYTGQIFLDLTVAQIDSDNVDELINKVARRYVKTPGAGRVI